MWTKQCVKLGQSMMLIFEVDKVRKAGRCEEFKVSHKMGVVSVVLAWGIFIRSIFPYPWSFVSVNVIVMVIECRQDFIYWILKFKSSDELNRMWSVINCV